MKLPDGYKVLLALFIFVVIWISAYQYMSKPSYTTEAFENIQVGANAYKVHEDLENPKLAAETMAKLNQSAKQLIYKLNSKYIDDHTGLASINPQCRQIVVDGIINLTKNFKTANMEENIPERSGGDTSYVIDKGAIFAMCLRDPKNGNRVEESDKIGSLSFVLFHEMAHLFTTSYGHDSLFWNNFKFLLQEASAAGLYSPIDYKKNATPYCGIVITYSPLYDKDLQEYHLDN